MLFSASSVLTTSRYIMFPLSYLNHSPPKHISVLPWAKLLGQAVSWVTGWRSPLETGAHPWPYSCGQGSRSTWKKACILRNFKEGPWEMFRSISEGGELLAGALHACPLSGKGILLTLLSRSSLSVCAACRSNREPLRFHLILTCFPEK